MNTNVFFKLIATFTMLLAVSCTKVTEPSTTLPEPGNSQSKAAARNNLCDFFYAVTEYQGPNDPSLILQFDYNNPSAPPVNIVTDLQDIKGIAQIGASQPEYYITTGPNNPVGYQNVLCQIDPNSGNPMGIPIELLDAAGNSLTVSDICLIDRIAENFLGQYGFVGLDNNTNTLVHIPLVGNWQNASSIVCTLVPISSMPMGYTARGLSWMSTFCDPLDPFGLFVNAVSSVPGEDDEFLLMDRYSGVIQRETYSQPVTELQGTGALGWLYCHDQMFIGRNAGVGYGFNGASSKICAQGAPLSFGIITSTYFSGADYPIEDFCTIPY